MNENLIKKVTQTFKSQFATDPLIIFSPGRINLIGEHTDYNMGFAFPAAIDKGIVLAISKSDKDDCKTYALDKQELYQFNIYHIEPLQNGGWRNYVIGVVHELKVIGKSIGAFNAVFAGDIPSGAGMSSSAALENSFVYGLNALFELGLSKAEMIRVSQKAEHNFAGVKCGIMDQYASMFGVENSALLLDCRTIEAEPYTIDFKGYQLMLINTNVQHNLAESAYNDRRAVCEKVSDLLQIDALRDATATDLTTIKTDISKADYQKALYVINENERVILFSKSIQKGDLKALGRLLFDSHKGLRNQYQVSCKELDFLVELARKNPYVIGSRMMGGGFGGCTINLVHEDGFADFEKEVFDKFSKEFENDCSVYRVKLAQGTRIIT